MINIAYKALLANDCLITRVQNTLRCIGQIGKDVREYAWFNRRRVD